MRKILVNSCLQMSRTVSARISNEVHDEIRERCNKAGCTINDWLVALIDFHFSGSSEFDFGDEEEVEEEKQEPQLIVVRDIPEDEPKPTATVVI